MYALGVFGLADFVTYNYYEKRRKRLTRITESFKNKFGGQYEILRSNVGLLITPCFNNIHSFDQFNKINDEYATEINIKDFLDHHIDWQSQILSFKNIPETQLNIMTKYWDTFRKEPYFIKDKYYIYKLIQNDYNNNNNIDIDIKNGNIIYDDLKDTDLNDIITLGQAQKMEMNKFYLTQIIDSERVALGAYDTEKNRKLIAYSYVNMDDLSASNIVIDDDYKGNDDDIALKLSQLTVNQHFEQGYDHINVNVDVEDLQSAQLRENMGFKKLPETYYWIQTVNA